MATRRLAARACQAMLGPPVHVGIAHVITIELCVALSPPCMTQLSSSRFAVPRGDVCRN
jgi:hypothetical protein